MPLPRKSHPVQIPMVVHEYKANRLCISVEAMDTFKVFLSHRLVFFLFSDARTRTPKHRRT